MTEPNDIAIDQIVATCNGDVRGALKALLLVNEQLETELMQLYAAIEHGGKEAAQPEYAAVLH